MAQPTADLSQVRAQSCTGCKIELQRVVRLGSASDPELLGHLQHAAADGRGRYAAENSTGDGVLIFDRFGRFVQRIGRRGQGPGEFFAITAMFFGPGDSLWVMNGPYAMVFAPDLRFVRSTKRPSSQWGTGVSLADGTLVTASMTGADLSHILFLSRGSSETVQGLDKRRELYHARGSLEPKCGACLVPVLIRGNEQNTFWSINTDNYRVRQWSSDGKLLTDFSIRSPRFPLFEDDNRGDIANTRIRPLIRSAGILPDGVLIVAGDVASSKWKPNPLRASSATRARKGQVRSSARDSAAYLLDQANRATLLQAVSTSSRKVLAERQFDGRQLWVNGALLFEIVTDADGINFIEVWRPVLRY
jgi:hypothetical protein